MFRLSPKGTVSVAAFAAIYAILRTIPAFPILGVSGGAFTLADALPPLYGIILGPYKGSSAVITGTFISFILGRPILFLGLDFLPGTVNAVIAGTLYGRRRLIPAAVFTILLMLFLINPYTVNFVTVKFFDVKFPLFFAWMHLIALLLMISPISYRIAEWIDGKPHITRTPIGIFLISFVATMGQHLMGNLLYENVIGVLQGTPPSAFKPVWYAVFWLYPIERLTLAALTTIISTPLLKLMRNYLGIQT
ncbi:MAG: hypothetical protein ACP5K1_04205 [Candidatus Bathyarchaeia archaeon]